MTDQSAVSDSLDALRVMPLFEWTFAVAMANLTIQVYRFIAQLTTFIFDIFKLSYGVDLFWPLTTDDLKPYTHYFTNKDETVFKLVESSILAFIAFYGVSALLKYSVLGLIIYTLIFFIHCSISLLGLILVGGKLDLKKKVHYENFKKYNTQG